MCGDLRQTAEGDVPMKLTYFTEPPYDTGELLLALLLDPLTYGGYYFSEHSQRVLPVPIIYDCRSGSRYLL